MPRPPRLPMVSGLSPSHGAKLRRNMATPVTMIHLS